MELKRMPYFQNKNCEVCKHPAKKYRIMGTFKGNLCDNKACDLAVSVAQGFVKMNLLPAEQ